ncbi:MAG: 2-C-methyl-D-erythritol 4-phosphate cytidylyltransferase, partial [Croceibacterium sp.]
MAPSPAVPFAAVIAAAGQGLRAGLGVPKQFALWRGKALVRRAAEALLDAGAHPLVVAIPAGADGLAGEVLAGLDVRLVTGGDTRQQSVRQSLESLQTDAPAHVLIHDAARAEIPPAVIGRLLAALADHAGAIPVLPIVDSVAVTRDGLMTERADREVLRRVQTPQGFRFGEILAAHRAWTAEVSAGDDAQVARAAGLAVALVEGDERLRKFTFAEDFVTVPAHPRTGTGFDVHRLA